MRQHPFSRLARLGGAFLLTGLLTCAQAVELGDALVRSHLGQPLSADIELTGIANDAATVQVALADMEVYRGANISMHPALASLNITIIRRDGKRILHIASPKPVESEFVNIFFELNENGRRAVRQTTLWFTPDPNPPPPKVVAPPVAAPAPLPTPVPVRTLAPPPPRAIAAPVAVAPMLRPAPPAACVQQFTAAQIGTCVALDAKNAALSAQIVVLEEKVRRLTVAMQAGAVVAERPLVKPLPAQLTPMGAPVSKPAGATPWLFIGIACSAVFALIGVLLFMLQRKRRAAKVKSGGVVGPGFIAKVKQRLMPGKKAEEKAA